jgi:hypothetical protein
VQYKTALIHRPPKLLGEKQERKKKMNCCRNNGIFSEHVIGGDRTTQEKRGRRKGRKTRKIE